ATPSPPADRTAPIRSTTAPPPHNPPAQTPHTRENKPRGSVPGPAPVSDHSRPRSSPPAPPEIPPPAAAPPLDPADPAPRPPRPAPARESKPLFPILLPQKSLRQVASSILSTPFTTR